MEPHLDLNAPGGYEEAYAAQQAAYAAHVVEEHAAAQQQAMADPAQPMKTCRRCCVRAGSLLLLPGETHVAFPVSWARWLWWNCSVRS